MKIKTKSKKVNKAWLNDHVNDPYVKLAQKEGYRARAAYKLKEIDEALGLGRRGDEAGRVSHARQVGLDVGHPHAQGKSLEHGLVVGRVTHIHHARRLLGEIQPMTVLQIAP